MIESRSGSVTTMRVDDNPQNEQKEKFEKFVNFYRNVLMNVSVSIKTLEELTKQAEEITTFQSYCPAFFQSVFHNFWAQSVIELNECFNGEFCFRKLFTYVEANWNKVFTGEWLKTTNWQDGEIENATIRYGKEEIFQRIKEAKNILLQNEKTILKIKTFRDKVFAHIDKNYPKEKLRLKELREIFTAAERCFNAICGMYNLTHTCLEPTNSDDVQNLINVVETYDKYQTQIRELRDKEIREIFYGRNKK